MMKESEIRPLELFNTYLALAREDCEKSVAFWSSHFYKDTYEARKEKIFRPRAARVREIVERYSVQPRALVDVGAGYGIFLEELKSLDLFDNLIAVELNPELAAICEKKGFRVVPTRLEAVPYRKVRANCASAFEILEHVFAPAEFLKAVHNLLEPQGLLILTTLTVSGFDIQVLWQNSKSVHPPHHLNLISVNGMQQLIARSRFQALEITTPGVLDVDIVANAVKEDANIELPRFISHLLKCDVRTRQNFQEFLKSNHLSSHIQVVARR